LHYTTSAGNYTFIDPKEDIESAIDVHLVAVVPPVELFALASKVSELGASAVIIDELLQQRSDATYMGIDAFDYLTRLLCFDICCSP
jgi:hypothetical protein